MRIRLHVPAILLIFFSACIKAYLPFVNEPSREEILNAGRKLYPELFNNPDETEKIGNPSIKFAIDGKDGIGNSAHFYAVEEMFSVLSSYGFSTDDKKPEIIIKGSVNVFADSSKTSGGSSGFGSFQNYKAACDIKAEEYSGGKQIAVFKSVIGGLGLSSEEAAEAAMANAGREAGKVLAKGIISHYRSIFVVRLEIYNLQNFKELNDFYIRLKTVKGVKNAWLTDYRGGNAYFDVSCSSGGAGNLARGLMETFGTELKINRSSLMKLEAAAQKKQ